MRRLTGLLLWAALQAATACEQSADPQPGATGLAPSQNLDRTARAGRVFMYLDDSGAVVKTSRYEDIPLDKRAAVMVIEGRTRSRARPRKEGGITIEALPPKVTAAPEEQAGASNARAILARHPPAEPGPPSTENWSDAQWREELKRELQELQREQDREPGPE